MSNLNVLVVGASIAGPMTAYWLAKTGAKVTVIERFPSLRTSGQSIDIRTSGVTVMRKIPGMEAAVRAKATPLEGISFVREDGRSFGTLKATGNPDQQSLVSEYEIFRGDLARVLYDLTNNNESIKYVFGEQVASMQQDEKEYGPIRVEFANGSPTADYDLVVACDGATSRTRALAFGCGVRTHIKPTDSWAAYFTLKQNLLEGSKMGHGYSAVGSRFIALGPDPSGVSRATLMCHQPRSVQDPALPFHEVSKQGDDALKRFITQHYRGAGWKTDEILEGMLEADDFYASEIVQVKLPSPYKGRFALVGDAGYAPGMTGTGTTLAITGAYVLAGEIGKHQGDLAAGLSGYEERMRPIVTDMQKVPPFIFAFLAPQTAWGIWLRRKILTFILWTGILEFLQKYFASSFASSDKYKLPDYEWVA